MPGAVWDIDTAPGGAGALVRPLRYVEGSEAVRVLVWIALATEVGRYLFDTGQGLDHPRILDPGTSDAERAALVRDVVLAVDGVAELLAEPEVEVDDTGAAATITVQARTIYDEPIEVTL